ncbi:hypothetical protein FIBSPDRAFT_797797, partial [Athelia psychrophila]
MKRTLDNTSDKPSEALSSGRIQAKRPKSSQACSSCRKHKTRCELIDNPSPADAHSGAGYRCHRCKVLNISCSFESSEFAPQLMARATPSPPPYLRYPHPTSTTGTEPPRIGPQNNPLSLAHRDAHAMLAPATPRLNSAAIKHGFIPREGSVTTPHTPQTPLGNVDAHIQQKEDYIKLEDLFPLPPNAPWGFVKVPGGFDWTATPMLAMQNITTSRAHYTHGEGEGMELHASLANILGPDNIKNLLHFESRYSPWINLQPFSAPNPSMLLTLAHCLVASRHLDPATRSAVVPPLQKLTEDAILRHVFSAIPSTQAIQAVMVLSLWCPIGGGEGGQGQGQGQGRGEVEVRDGRLLVASAVSMAMNLRLSQAIEYVAGLREEIRKEEVREEDVEGDIGDGVEKARLWLSLMNAEWLLCVGTGRSPLSQRTSLDHAAIEWSSHATIGACRDMRLALVGQLVEVTEAALRLHFEGKADFGRFYKEVNDVCTKFDNLLRLISPLPVVAEHEVFYFHFLVIYHNVCRLLVMHHCLRETRRVYADNSGQLWHTLAEHGGINLAAQWGQEALLLAEGTLSAILSIPAARAPPHSPAHSPHSHHSHSPHAHASHAHAPDPAALLNTAPDQIFAMLCFAASFLVMCKLAIHQNHGADLPGSSDLLLARAVELLVRSACAPDHAPAKCAQLIRGLIASFEARVRKRAHGAGVCGAEGGQGGQCNTSAVRTSVGRELRAEAAAGSASG